MRVQFRASLKSPIWNRQTSGAKPKAQKGAETRPSTPETLLPRTGGRVGGCEGHSFQALEVWVAASWGSPRPRRGWASRVPPLPAVAVSVHVLLGIRELLAAPTEILPLTAIAGRGCLHGNNWAEKQSPALLGCCSALPHRSLLWSLLPSHLGGGQTEE